MPDYKLGCSPRPSREGGERDPTLITGEYGQAGRYATLPVLGLAIRFRLSAIHTAVGISLAGSAHVICPKTLESLFSPCEIIGGLKGATLCLLAQRARQSPPEPQNGP